MNDNQNLDERRVVVESASEARQGPWGRPVFMVLIGGLALVMVAWTVAEFWGESIDQDPQATASTKPDPINAQPSGSGAFDDNPASGPARAPEAADRDPTVQGNGGGPTMITTPNGTEKTR
ncbi:hypothetical protein [Rhizobium bangladeshense]|uniref:Uncharacterized protein n=2 Tax=Rhizobium TaxID=379 RepID=A0ABS7LQK5_9HYPH|nr:hypothetical protein [Rhizobium bangladeshense]TLX08180.1 hypothetical protein FFR93_30050 [Rhizobium sp. MHM7A]MBX4870422.1 hypothetical protein [Rhizobium bangladeshense]MBX4876078.1 hypothetical protein [Rhizobium bangladeshense]MBX4905206.1 hypothetical protein [Rhizobium bangladeshense]MBX4917241.1 hypothetical protein [Rhizobium bangladeshense]